MRHTKDIRVPRRSGVAGLYAVPVLVELADDPNVLGMLGERTTRVVGDESAASGRGPLVYRLPNSDAYGKVADGINAAWQAADGSIPFDIDDIMTVEEVARVLHLRRDWIIRRSRKLPFVKQMSRKKYVCSRIRLRHWLAAGSGPVKGV